VELKLQLLNAELLVLYLVSIEISVPAVDLLSSMDEQAAKLVAVPFEQKEFLAVQVFELEIFYSLR